MLMHQLILDAAERTPDREAFHWVDRGRGLDYAGAVGEIRRFAAVLHEVGVRPGDRVTIVAHNGLDYLTAIFGCAYLGAIAALVNVKFRDSLGYYVADHDPTAIVYTHDLHDEVRAAAAAAPSLKALVCMDGPQDGALSLPALMAADLPVPAMAVDASAPVHLSYTSGTTGQPKGAVLRHEPTVTAARCIGERLRITGADVSFGPTALSSSYQLVGNLLPQLAKGVTINIMGGWTPEAGYRAVVERGATMLIGNPPVLQDFLDAARVHGAPAGLRMSLSGGGAVPPTLRQAWAEELGIPLVESYGQSELGGFIALGYPVLTASEPGERRIGPALPDKEVRILDANDEEVPLGEVGEICLTGGFMAGYWGKPDKTAETLRGGWLHSGDLGVMDRDGYVTLRGRRAELIDVDGQAWFPRDVEESLMTVHPIREAAVVGVARDGGTVPIAAVTTHDGADVDVAAAIAAVASAVPYDASRLEIVRVEAFPMTPTGKIAKATLREQLQ